MSLELMLSRLESGAPRPNGNGSWQAHCPCHEDRKASLSLSATPDGTVLLHGYTGCDPQAIVTALGLQWSDLFPKNAHAKPPKRARRIVATYENRDEIAKLIYQAIRYEPKDIKQRRPDPKGNWIWNLQGVRRIPAARSERVA